jgi:PhnB protein
MLEPSTCQINELIDIKEKTMKLNPYLMFKGQCETAFKFYEKCLGGKIAGRLTYGESPMAGQTPAELHDQIMHMELAVDDMVLMGADCPPNLFEEPKGFHVSLQFHDPVEAERIFNALAEKGTVQMPFQETPWSERFAMLIDQFGMPWMINCLKAT